jgi:hypothetical protein
MLSDQRSLTPSQALAFTLRGPRLQSTHPNMSLADYLAKNYLTADSEKKSKKRKRKNKDGGLTIDDDDNLGWKKTAEDDDDDAPMIGNAIWKPRFREFIY